MKSSVSATQIIGQPKQQLPPGSQQRRGEQPSQQRLEPKKQKRRRRKNRRKKRLEAVLIQPKDGNKYADVLKTLKTKVDPTLHNVEIRTIRQTRKEGILLELCDSTDKTSFVQAVNDAVGNVSEVKGMTPRTRIEILDIDETTDKREVIEAIAKAFESEVEKPDLNQANVKLSLRPFRGLIRAEVDMVEGAARKLLDKQRLKIGWVSCRVRAMVRVTRCYECFGFGHMASNCKGVDRTKLCWKCGKADHKALDCKEQPRCGPCADASTTINANHLVGSNKCPTFLEALKKLKNRG